MQPTKETPNFKIWNNIMLRLYSDTRPHNLETADIQKGLVLVVDEVEVIDEGVGFGTPVAIYSGIPFFSKSAEVHIEAEDENVLKVTKSFLIDTISRKRILKRSYINDRFYSFVQRFFMEGYRKYKRLRFFFTGIMEFRRALLVRTIFVKTNPKGRINVTYTCYSNKIQVDVDLKNLDKSECGGIMMMNEQGASFFCKYSDSDMNKLYNEDIGCWNRIEANEVSLSDIEGRFSFKLKRKKGSIMYGGWEKVRGSISWAGLAYSIGCKKDYFEYCIFMEK